MNPRIPLFALVAAVCVGCGQELVIPPVERIEVGMVRESTMDVAEIQVPDTVDVGEQLTISVVSLADSCRRKSHTELDVIPANQIAVTPLDWVTVGSACDSAYQEVAHSRTWSFGTPSTLYRVVVRGRTGPRGPIESHERFVWVR